MSKKGNFPKSVKHASSGIKAAFRNEPNFRIHTLVAIISVLLGIFLNLSPMEWIILILVISVVIILELLNTAIEKIVDIVRPNYSPIAKVIKDMSAAAVMIAAVAAIAVGLLLFVPKILLLVSF